MDYYQVKRQISDLKIFALKAREAITFAYTQTPLLAPLTPDCFISGGFLAGMATDRKDTIGDIDYYCTTQASYNYLKEWYVRQRQRRYDIITSKETHSIDYQLGIKMSITTVTSEVAFFRSVKSIQIIYPQDVATMNDIIKSFDYTHLAAYFNESHQYFASPLTLYCLQNSILLPQDGATIDPKREKKYLQQGYQPR